MKNSLILMLVLTAASLAAAEVPNADDFRIVPQFPDPAAGAFLVLGSNLGNGRLVLWDGDSVYLQEFTGEPGPLFVPIASGYNVPPSFVAVKSDNRTVVLGSTRDGGVDGHVYQLNLDNPVDFEPGFEIVVPDLTDFFGGVLLNDRFVLLEAIGAANDVRTNQLVTVDLNSAQAALSAHPLPSRGFPYVSGIVDIPAESAFLSLYVDKRRNLLYALSVLSGDLRTFKVSALIQAHNDGTMLDWTLDSTPFGEPGQFSFSFVIAVNPDAELILSRLITDAGGGIIEFIDTADPSTTIGTLDPAGTMPPYWVIYNSALDEIIAADFSNDDSIDVYATERAIPAIPPESPCDDFDAIDAAFATFRTIFAMYTADSNDIDADGIPDTAMLEMIELFCLRGIDEPLVLSADSAYDLNLAAFDAEVSATALQAFREVIALLMTMSQAMQNNVRAALDASGNPLFETYAILTCSDLENCLPEFVEDPDPVLRGARAVNRAINEPYSAQGDPDGDGLTNLQEYLNVMEMGGDDFDFAIAASSDKLDGTSGIRGAGSGGGCLIATAAYGTPLAGEIGVLRTLRDERMLGNPIGTSLVDLYYRVSPPLADQIAAKPALADLVRALLYPLIAAARSTGIALMFVVAMATLAITALLTPYPRRGLTRNE